MVIQSLDLINYRNYESLKIEFDKETNILFGDNAQGKTNILEAIFLSATTKSHKSVKDKEIISFLKEESHIKTELFKNNRNYKIDIHLNKSGKKNIAVNNQKISKASELLGILNVVLFSPEDLAIIKNGPADRRRFIDMELCQLDKSYIFNLTNYNKIVNQRNKLLRDIIDNGFLKETLTVWNMQLFTYGEKIIEQREKFIGELNEIIKEIHLKLSGGIENLILKYEPNCEKDKLEKEIEKNTQKDILIKQTTVGPHRDDISFYINEIDIRKYGSQGQQKTAALSLKLAEIELVKKTIHENPVLLLDDVLSELDSSRQNFLLNYLGNIQTIITCTGLDEFINNHFKINKTFKITKGTIESTS